MLLYEHVSLYGLYCSYSITSFASTALISNWSYCAFCNPIPSIFKFCWDLWLRACANRSCQISIKLILAKVFSGKFRIWKIRKLVCSHLIRLLIIIVSLIMFLNFFQGFNENLKSIIFLRLIWVFFIVLNCPLLKLLHLYGMFGCILQIKQC